jgi:hypothetical protein
MATVAGALTRIAKFERKFLLKDSGTNRAQDAVRYRAITAQFFCPMVETRSTMSESILRRSFRRPFSGFNLRLRTMMVRSRIWCNISRGTCSIGPYDLSAARQTSRSFSSRAIYALATVRKSRCSACSSDSSMVTGDDSLGLRRRVCLHFVFAFMRQNLSVRTAATVFALVGPAANN